MNSSCQILPGVKSIGWVLCSSLPKQIALSGISRLPVALLADIHEITLFGSSDCRCSTEKDNNGWHQTASLTFFSSEEVPFENNIAFVVKDVNGNAFIIGSYEKPYPKVSIDSITGSPDNQSAGYKYSVSHKAIRTLVPCLV